MLEARILRISRLSDQPEAAPVDMPRSCLSTAWRRLSVWWGRWGLFVKFSFLIWLVAVVFGPTVAWLAEDQRMPDVLLLGLGLICALAAFCLAGIRWALVASALRYPIPLAFALRFNFVGLFFYCVTPFGIGMDVLKVMKSLDAVASLPIRMAVIQVMLDRLLGLTCLLVAFAAIGVLVYPDVMIWPIVDYLARRPDYSWAAAVIVIVVAACVVFAAWRWFNRNHGLIKEATNDNSGAWLKVLAATTTSFASQFLHVAAILVLMWSFGREGNYWAIAAASFGSMVFFFIPISVFGVGAPQIAAVAILIALGFNTRDASLVVLLSFATVVVGGLVGGYLEISQDLRARKARRSARSD